MPFSPATPGGLRRRVLRGAVLSLAVQLAAALVNYALTITLARAMGAGSFGVYSLVSAWSAPLVLVAALGMPAAVIRFLPEYGAAGDWARFHGFIRLASRVTLAASLAAALAVTGAIALGWQAGVVGTPVASAVCVAAWGVPLLVRQRLLAEMSRAAGQTGNALVIPLLQPLILLGAALVLLWHGTQVTSAVAVALPLLGVVVALPLQRRRLRRGLEAIAPMPARISTEPRGWLAVSLPLLAIDGCLIVLNQLDLLTIGLALGPREAALYSAAAATGMFLLFAWIAVNTVAQPAYPRLHADRDLAAIGRLSRLTTRWALFPTAAGAGLVCVLARPLLGLFGAGFEDAAPILMILALGHLVNVSTGPVANLLNLCGHHGASLRVFGVCAVLNIALVALLLPALGAPGAALATVLSMAAWNLVLHRIVLRRIGVRPSPLSRLLAPRLAERTAS
jgi:O-antigen/teichoic acid export membrane protein